MHGSLSVCYLRLYVFVSESYRKEAHRGVPEEQKETSMLTFEGQQFAGAKAIVEKLAVGLLLCCVAGLWWS